MRHFQFCTKAHVTNDIKHNYPKMNGRKIALVLGILLTFGILLLVLQQPTGRAVKDSDFKPIPYTHLAKCERNAQGEFNCPDIRHKGTTRLRQAQLVLTRILRIFDLIAKKHGIRYWLYKGTLLGAVRHNGHIPFDNDVDICIPKEDFEKFVENGTKELPEDIFFQTEETDPHWKVPYVSNMLGKLRDTRSCLKSCSGGCNYNDGLMLDMFVLESDSNGNFLEVYTSKNWLLRGYVYTPIKRKQSDIFPRSQVNFDGFSLPAPREWEKVLKSLYGDDFMIVRARQPLGHIITDTLHSCKELDK